ncbi:hypothetical protein AALO_G00133140 [Alosa alosa]|uniref:Uncharacterized protein n=1 Tax=Alosa alosa TaxID=278164 RepID=A0AAV6GKL2_9TELE|nr:hypothetical protein AALO_G00133140 [Alosa alosa]
MSRKRYKYYLEPDDESNVPLRVRSRRDVPPGRDSPAALTTDGHPIGSPVHSVPRGRDSPRDKQGNGSRRWISSWLYTQLSSPLCPPRQGLSSCTR